MILKNDNNNMYNYKRPPKNLLNAYIKSAPYVVMAAVSMWMFTVDNGQQCGLCYV